MQIRGSNFQEQATILIDNTNRQWLWKNLQFPSLIREYVVSFLASELGIYIPRSIVARRGQSIGLVQEWIHDAKDLSSSQKEQLIPINRAGIFDLLVFEAWIGAFDRHGGNYLTSFSGELWGIDFEESFSSNCSGSELPLYFPWISQNPSQIQESIWRLKMKIDAKQLLNVDENLFNTLSILLNDPRGKVVLFNQLIQMFKLLRSNFSQLTEVVGSFLQKSVADQEFLSS